MASETASAEGVTGSVSCARCKYLRMPMAVSLVSQKEMNYPGVSDEWIKWVESKKGRQRAEMEMFDRNEDFLFEPEFFPWCEYWTDAGESRWPSDALGRKVKIYELTARRNENNDCKHFKPKTSDLKGNDSNTDDQTDPEWRSLKGF